MTLNTPVRIPGAEWRAFVRKNGTNEFAAAFAPNPVLETAVMNDPLMGVDAIGSFFAVTTAGMYDSLTFTHETVDGLKTYLEWEGRFHADVVGGATIVTRNEAGLIESIRLYHRPLRVVQQFSAELGKRLKGKVNPNINDASVAQRPNDEGGSHD